MRYTNQERTATVTQNSTGGIGFFGLLTIVFVVLKALGYITWSWWWVFSPLWIPWTIVLGIGLVGLVIWGMATGIIWLTGR